jgi:hypothetical protein
MKLVGWDYLRRESSAEGPWKLGAGRRARSEGCCDETVGEQSVGDVDMVVVVVVKAEFWSQWPCYYRCR